MSWNKVDIRRLFLFFFLEEGPIVPAEPPPTTPGPGPRIQEGIGTFQAGDGTWHLVLLSAENDGEGGVINVPKVDQGTVAAPGDPYIGYAVLQVGAVKRKLIVIVDDGIYSLWSSQEDTAEELSGDVELAAPGGFFPVTIIVEDGVYIPKAAQP